MRAKGLEYCTTLACFILLQITPLYAQSSLALSSVTGIPGTTISMDFSASSSGTTPTALQWTLSAPGGNVTNLSVAPDPSLTAAGKSISCSGNVAAYLCVASGGNAAIPNGVVARVSADLSATAATSLVSIAKGAGVSAVGDPLTVTATGGLIAVAAGLVSPPTLSGIGCAPSTLGPGGASICTAALTAATSTGMTVSLRSNTNNLTVPASVFIPVNASSATFLATASAFTAGQSAIITASLGTVSTTATLSLVINMLVSNLQCAAGTLTSNSGTICTVTISSAAPAGGIAVTITDTSPALTIPASVTVPASATSVSFPVTTGSISDPQTSVVTASLAGSSRSVSISLLDTVSVSNLQCAVGTLAMNASTTCTVTISSAAPAGGAVVTLTDNATALTVPASVTVPPSATSVTFTATAGTIPADQSATITASLNGASQTVTLSLIGSVTVTNLQCTATSLAANASTTCTVTVSKAASTGGAVVALTDNATALSLPSSVTVAASATSATFTASTGAISADLNATITASLNGASKTFAISLIGSITVSGLQCTASSLSSNTSTTCTLTISKATSKSGTAVALTDNSTGLTVPASVTVAASATSVAFTASAGTISADQSATITASLNGFSRTATISLVAPMTVSSLQCAAPSLLGNTITNCTVTLSKESPGGVVVKLSDNSSPLTIPTSVTVGDGAASATFIASAVPVLSNQTATITASLNGVSKTDSILLVAPSFWIRGESAELSGTVDGSKITPAKAPTGFTGKLDVNGTGSVHFTAAHSGNGVYFLNCCANTNNAYYRFAGSNLGSIFNVNQGQITFYLKSRYSFDQRQTNASGKRYAFDIRDGSGGHLFTFLTQVVSGSLEFEYAMGGNAQWYYVPKGTEDDLFGAGVTLKVTMMWNGTTCNLYFNDVLVKSTPYTVPAPQWTTDSNFNLGGYEYQTFGGYFALDDVMDEFVVSTVAGQ